VPALFCTSNKFAVCDAAPLTIRALVAAAVVVTVVEPNVFPLVLAKMFEAQNKSSRPLQAFFMA
jgi:hypothetical protein